MISLISDAYALGDQVRDARLNRQLSQAELAAKLGIRQRQISDLERATVDPRLSTIQNVARALDLELLLVPRHLIAAVEALRRPVSDAGSRPLYALADEDTDAAAGGASLRSEVGDSTTPPGQRGSRSRARRRAVR